MNYDVTPSDEFSYTLCEVGNERQSVVMVDGFLRDPDSMVRFAREEALFASAPSDYPGVIAPTPAPYAEALLFGLAPLLKEVFGVDPRSAEVLNSFYGMVTTHPGELKFSQRIPHFDNLEPTALAVLHYFCDETQGGTAFYRHRATGYESVDQERAGDYFAALDANLRESGPLGGEYVATSNRLFEQTAIFESRFNRLLLYQSRVLHSGQIGPRTVLSDDPRIGRLTANTFLRFGPS